DLLQAPALRARAVGKLPHLRHRVSVHQAQRVVAKPHRVGAQRVPHSPPAAARARAQGDRRSLLGRRESEAGALARLRLRHQARRARLYGGRLHGLSRGQRGVGEGGWRYRLLRAAEGEHQPLREAGRLVGFRAGVLGRLWPRKPSRTGDPYWESFVNTPPADLANSAAEIIRRAPAGNVFPTRTELHTPEITARHVKEMARYLGADLVGIVSLKADDDPLPFAVVCAVRAEHDPRTSPGVGGQVPVQNGLFVTFVLSAWIRELG